MAWNDVIWVDGPGGNVEHIAANDVSPAEVEQVLDHPVDSDVSATSGLPIVFGYTSTGRLLAVIYEPIDAITVHPITAFEVETKV